MRAVDRKRQRGPQLVAVKGAMACPVHPARRQPRPFGQVAASTMIAVASLVAGKSDAAGTKIFGTAGRRKAAKAEALVRECNRAIRVAVTRSDRVAEAGNEDIAHRNVGGRAARGLTGCCDVDRHLGRLPVEHTGPYRGTAFGVRSAGGCIALWAEAPAAGRPSRNHAGEPDLDAVVSRVEVIFPHLVAHALIRNLADTVDTEPPDDVACPAVAVGCGCECLLCLQHGSPLRRLRLAAEIALIAEQPEPINDGPRNGDAGRRFD